MGKSTAPARSNKAVSRTINFISSSFAEYIESLPGIQIGERPAKKPKLEQGTVLSACVSRQRLSVQLPFQGDFSHSLSIKRNDVSAAIRLTIGHLDGNNGDDGDDADDEESIPILTIAPASSSALFRDPICVPLDPSQLSQQLRTLVWLYRRFPKSIQETKPWINVDLALEVVGTDATLDFELALFWNETTTPDFEPPSSRAGGRALTQNIIDLFLPNPDKPAFVARASWSPMDFYQSAFTPPADDAEASAIEVKFPNAAFYPYQKRSLRWLLGREGVEWTPEDGIREADPAPVFASDAFRPVRDFDGKQFYLNDLCHVITSDPEPFATRERTVKGGILAEEMGLGKTLEIIGLILLHRRPESTTDVAGPAPGRLRRVGATLIITPLALQQQWLSELKQHAPHLRAYIYNGRKKIESEEDEEKLIEELCQYDVVITMYHHVRSEAHFLIPPPSRSMRHERKHARKQSPLAAIEWWRICLDEAQMVESTVTMVAAAARSLHRVNAWAVTGTPVKNDVDDLRGLLYFLQFEPYCSDLPTWQALVTGNKPLFRKLFNRLSLRHTKAMVAHEMHLPVQNRYVISMPLTAVEEQYYQTLFREMAQSCGLDPEGNPLTENWSLRIHGENMKTWLNRLRRAALHLDVRDTLGTSKSQHLRTIEQVLDAMIEQNDSLMLRQRRARLNALLDLGQLYEGGRKVRTAYEIWTEARGEIDSLVAESRNKLRAAWQEEKVEAGADAPGTGGPGNNEPGEDELLEKGTGNKGKFGEASRRLRSALLLYHRATFFCGNACFQVCERHGNIARDSDEYTAWKQQENSFYNTCRIIRREVMQETSRKASKIMDKIRERASNQNFAQIPEPVPFPNPGIQTLQLAERLKALYGALNSQAAKIVEWREAAIRLVLMPLIDDEERGEGTGEDLDEVARVQEELMATIQAFRAIVADRQEGLTGQTNELVKHQVRLCLRSARANRGPAPEVTLTMLGVRDKLKPGPELGSLRGALHEIRNVSSAGPAPPRAKGRDGPASGARREGAEKEIAAKLLRETQLQFSEQNKVLAQLEAEADLFTSALNAKIEYYRQLQDISDSVAAREDSRGKHSKSTIKEEIKGHQMALATSESKHRYLMSLKESGASSNEPKPCNICDCLFVFGALTVCGHEFCKQCMMKWLKIKQTCPACKRALKPSNLHDFVLKPQELKIQSESLAPPVPASKGSKGGSTLKTNLIYKPVDAGRIAEIQGIRLDGPPLAAKVSTILRHLIWLGGSDPGAKSIIFSQYTDFLDLLRFALKQARIGHTSITQRNGITKFKDDPSVQCFLLNARDNSSGLNLVCASHVILCEPILNTALELQAIARVDRIGQLHPTTVWLYLVAGSVEESIHNLSVQRRLKHLHDSREEKQDDNRPRRRRGDGEGQDATESINEANTLELENAAMSKLMEKSRRLGEAVAPEDLWECLFGGVRRQEGDGPSQDSALQDRAVMSLLAADTAER